MKPSNTRKLAGLALIQALCFFAPGAIREQLIKIIEDSDINADNLPALEEVEAEIVELARELLNGTPEVTSDEVASKAGAILADPDSTPEARSVAASALSQARDKS